MKSRYFPFLLSIVCLLGFFIVFANSAEAQQPGISSPTPGQTLSDVVIVTGTASDASFLRFELAFLRDDDPDTGWIVFADGDQQIVDGQLAVWDTTVGQNVNAPIFPDGSYQLRLRVVRQDFNYDEFFAGNLIIQNNTAVEVATATPVPPPPTETPLPADVSPPQPPSESSDTAPSPTPDEALTGSLTPTSDAPTETPTVVPTATPLATRIAPTEIPTIILEETLEAPPEVLPTLTSFPTPTPAATPIQTAFNNEPPDQISANEEAAAEGVNGLVEGVLGYDYSLFGSAIGRGVRWALYAFLLIGIYFLLRNTVRWIWRTISSNW